MITFKTIPPELVAQFKATPGVCPRPGVDTKTVEYQGFTLMSTRYFCQDCLKPSPDLFMVLDWLWRHLGLNGIICLDCFEKRLGRPLVAQDFKDPKFNGLLFRTPPAPMPEPEWEAFVQSVLEKRP
jgi:hypothetical protein